MAKPPADQKISLDALVIMSRWSRRTWWRRIASGQAQRVEDDRRGRVMLSWDSVHDALWEPSGPQDVQIMLQADAGDAAAQNDFGQHLFVLNRPAAALYWIEQAAAQGCADAMQWLGVAHATGHGVARNDYLALMWIARAAAQGHVIAMAQADGLLGPAAPVREPGPAPWREAGPTPWREPCPTPGRPSGPTPGRPPGPTIAGCVSSRT